MSKDLEKNIARMEAELAEMKQKLEQSKKFEFQGGYWRLIIHSESADVIHDSKVYESEIPYRTQTKEAGLRLKDWVNNQIILWQVAEFVNDGWVRPKCNAPGSCEVFYDCEDGRFNLVPASASNHAIFKDKEAAKRACDILNEQADELGWVK